MATYPCPMCGADRASAADNCNACGWEKKESAELAELESKSRRKFSVVRLAVALTLLAMVALFVILLVGRLNPQENQMGQVIALNSSDEIYYKGTATEQDARRIGELLTNKGYLGYEEGSTVQVVGSAGEFHVNVVVEGEKWKDQVFVNRLKQMLIGAASELKLPVTLNLCNAEMEIQRTVNFRD